MPLELTCIILSMTSIFISPYDMIMISVTMLDKFLTLFFFFFFFFLLVTETINF